jgi:hypothetical protein
MPPEFLQKSDAEFWGAVCVEIAGVKTVRPRKTGDRSGRDSATAGNDHKN